MAPRDQYPDRVFNAAVVASILSTVAMLAFGIHGHAILPTIDLAMDTTMLGACASLAMVAWSRFWEARTWSAGYTAAAFQALAVAYALAVLLTLTHSDSIARLEQPENAQILEFAIARFGAALLFVVGAMLPPRPIRGRRLIWLLVVPTVGVLAVGLLGFLAKPFTDGLMVMSLLDPEGLPEMAPFGAVASLLTAALLFWAAFATRRQWWRDHAVLDGWIATGLVFAGFGSIHWALFPSAHPGQVSSGDIFWLAFAICLVIGLEAAVWQSLREVRKANRELQRLRDSAAEQATIEERTRLARELHDGLAQNLWLGKLRVAELAGLDDLSPAARRITGQLAAVVDITLAEAREAIAALRAIEHDDTSLTEMVRRAVEDFGDRFGMRAEFAFEGDESLQVPARTKAEILRIAQEALTNVARHASASIVGVRLTIHGQQISLRVLDNGRGFESSSVGPDSFGLASMRERTRLIGGRLRIHTRPSEGTGVFLRISLTDTTPRKASDSA